MEDSIQYFVEDISFELEDASEISLWLQAIIKEQGGYLELLTYVFCSDEYLLQMNKEHLEHDYYTDIITFPIQQVPLISDIFISVDRVQDNAQAYKVSFKDELHRVMVHGVLHLMGYDDHSDKDRKEMRKQETEALKRRSFLHDK